MAYGAAGFARGFSTSFAQVSEARERQAERERKKKQEEKEDALDKAYAETYGRVGQKDDYAVAIQEAGGNKGLNLGAAQQLAAQGTLRGNAPEDIAFERASAESAAGAMRENAVRQGAIPQDQAALPAMEPTTYTARQAGSDYATRAAGISRKGAIEALQIKQAYKQDERDEKFDIATQMRDRRLGRIYSVSESNGLKGLSEAAKKEGLNVAFVETKDGIGRINVLGPKGDVLETISSLPDAVSKLENLVMSRYEQDIVGLLGGPREALTYMNQRRELKLSEQRLGLQERDVRLKEEAAPGQRAYIGALTTKALQESGKGGMDPKTKEILDQYEKLSPEQQNGAEGQQLLAKAAASSARKTGDFKTAAALTSYGRAEEAYSKAAAEAAKNDMPPPNREEIFAGFGFAPAALEAAMRSGVNPKTKKPWTEAEINAFKKRYPNTPIGGDKPATTSAVPTPAAAPTAAPSGGARPGSAIPASSNYGTLGRLTPQAILERAAEQGNQSAVAELRRRQTVKEAEGSRPPEQSPFGF